MINKSSKFQLRVLKVLEWVNYIIMVIWNAMTRTNDNCIFYIPYVKFHVEAEAEFQQMSVEFPLCRKNAIRYFLTKNGSKDQTAECLKPHVYYW